MQQNSIYLSSNHIIILWTLNVWQKRRQRHQNQENIFTFACRLNICNSIVVQLHNILITCYIKLSEYSCFPWILHACGNVITSVFGSILKWQQATLWMAHFGNQSENSQLKFFSSIIILYEKYGGWNLCLS